jgi:D-beta-D-heptose 7-phosphate kinase/D-beta-D-heptose 1-phosphate adenosyltransferase
VVHQDGSAEHIRTVAKEVYDVSGAGDTAVATMGLGLAHSADIIHVVRLANAAAGVVVGKYGTASVTAGEIIARLGLSEEGQASSKYFNLDSVQQLVARWREMGHRIAFTNGCFDLLHPGHVHLLEQCRSMCDRLIVGINADSSVQRLKGPTRPAQGEAARAAVLASLQSVDMVCLFEDDTPIELIKLIKPDVLIKGADYTRETVVGGDLVESWGGAVALAHLLPGHSTTATLARLRG